MKNLKITKLALAGLLVSGLAQAQSSSSLDYQPTRLTKQEVYGTTDHMWHIREVPVVGVITRSWTKESSGIFASRGMEVRMPYILDPVTKEKVYLKSKDDLYEDSEGKLWGVL